VSAGAGWLAELQSCLTAPPEEPTGYRDFGGSILSPPQALVETRSRAELLRVLELAVRHRVALSVRGAGHSSGGQTAAPGGIVLRHRPPGETLHWRGDAIDVPGHYTWGLVEQSLEGSGRDLRVTTSCVGTTVAGTLSMGGFGPRSVRFGPQVDQVRELHLICVNGETVHCSPEHRPDYFFSALTGAGQLGIIERAVIETAPRKEHLSAVSIRHPSLGDLAAELGWLADAALPGPDYFCTLIKEGIIQTFCASSHASRREAMQDPSWLARSPWQAARVQTLHAGEFDGSDRHMPLERWHGCRHVWADYCFEWSGFARFAQFIDAELGENLREHIAYVICSAPRTGRSPSLDMRPSACGRLFSLGLFFSVPADDAPAIARVIQAHRRALAACIELGGRPYVYGVWGGREGLDRQHLERIFGGGYAMLRGLRGSVDPFGILNPTALN
jgi:FAD/FMN-containing dehydrogenase